MKHFFLALMLIASVGFVSSLEIGQTNVTGVTIVQPTLPLFNNATAFVNKSNWWDDLDTPADINAGDITDDGTYIKNYTEQGYIYKGDFQTTSGDFNWSVDDDGSNIDMNFPDIGGNNYLGWSTTGGFMQLYANPNPANDYLLWTVTETQGADTEINIYEGGTGHNRFWSSGSVRIGGGASSTCDNLTTDVDCNTPATGADLVVEDDTWVGGATYTTHLFSSDGITAERIYTNTGNTRYFEDTLSRLRMEERCGTFCVNYFQVDSTGVTMGSGNVIGTDIRVTGTEITYDTSDGLILNADSIFNFGGGGVVLQADATAGTKITQPNVFGHSTLWDLDNDGNSGGFMVIRTGDDTDLQFSNDVHRGVAKGSGTGYFMYSETSDTVITAGDQLGTLSWRGLDSGLRESFKCVSQASNTWGTNANDAPSTFSCYIQSDGNTNDLGTIRLQINDNGTVAVGGGTYNNNYDFNIGANGFVTLGPFWTGFDNTEIQYGLGVDTREYFNGTTQFFDANFGGYEYWFTDFDAYRFDDDVVVGDGTNQLNINGTGYLTLEGGARVENHISIQNANLGKGGTAPTQIIVNNYNAWEYTIGDDSVLHLEMPHDMDDSENITIDIIWYVNEDYATNNGEVQWEVNWSATNFSDSERIVAPADTGVIVSGDINIPATNNTLVHTEFEIDNSNINFGDLLGFTIERIAIDGGANPTADPVIVGVHMEYISNKLGTIGSTD